MENKKGSSYNGLFWGLTVGAVATLVGSAYYLYTLMSHEEELAEEDMKEIENLKEEVEIESGGALTVDTAIQIMAMTNRIAEETMKKNNPDLDARRRAVINNQEEYEKICQEVFESKESAYNDAMKKVLGQFGNVSMEEIHKLMQTVQPMELEKINHKYDKQNFDDSSVPDKKLVKDAFIFYGKKFKEEMNLFQTLISQAQYDPQQEQYLFFRMLTMKMKVDDLVFLKYKYTEPQIKYMLFEYNLFEDPEIRRVNEQLMRFDQMFAPQGE